MTTVTRIWSHKLPFNIHKLGIRHASEDAEFRALNLKSTKQKVVTRRKFVKPDVLPPRYKQMAVDQDWGNVWPGPKTFHPATVPLPLRQGYVKKGVAPDKFANAELMKIPNFLHLTPPVVQRQCEALKKFCTPWPKGLETDEQCEEHFPVEVTSSNYCYSSPSIRDPASRIVTVRIKLSKLPLDDHGRDKLKRLVKEKYDEETDYLTIVTDRCPLRKQNYDYAMYLLTALFHESWRVEPWEALKSEADMEKYDWFRSKSKETLEKLFGKPYTEVENSQQYGEAVDRLLNEGESEYLLTRYGESVSKLLGVPFKVL